MQGNGGSSKGLVSEINVTPLVDVMLVLLVIFMVTAPMMTQGVDVKLPQTESTAMPSAEQERLVVTIGRDKKILLDEFQVDMASLQLKIQRVLETRTNKEVFLRADESLPYGYVVQVMAEIRAAGVTKLGMVTEPLETKKKDERRR
ncbi:MAG: protein TolR [Deltaproteobacteria bacterium]|nr:protein TolR [Deltaproteobacteria bacterium]MBF0551049.1 protein TolR [Deltaproteobacteria bacterium]